MMHRHSCGPWKLYVYLIFDIVILCGVCDEQRKGVLQGSSQGTKDVAVLPLCHLESYFVAEPIHCSKKN